MNHHQSKKENMIKKIGNIFLMLSTSWIAFGICVLLFSKNSLTEFSIKYFSPDTSQIMGSTLLNILLRKEFVIIPIMVVIGMIIKEFKIQKLQKRIYLNIGLLMVVVIHCGLIGYLMFKPVFNST